MGGRRTARHGTEKYSIIEGLAAFIEAVNDKCGRVKKRLPMAAKHLDDI